MPRTVLFRSLLLSISVLALASCGGDNTQAKSVAPMPPVTEFDAEQPSAPQPLAASDTLTPILPSAGASTTTVTTTATTEPSVFAPVAAAPGSVEERIAKLEQTVNSLRSDYDRIMPAFASLNTTNERISSAGVTFGAGLFSTMCVRKVRLP